MTAQGAPIYSVHPSQRNYIKDGIRAEGFVNHLCHNVRLYTLKHNALKVQSTRLKRILFGYIEKFLDHTIVMTVPPIHGFKSGSCGPSLIIIPWCGGVSVTHCGAEILYLFLLIFYP